jgi:hypothetical protein
MDTLKLTILLFKVKYTKRLILKKKKIVKNGF